MGEWYGGNESVCNHEVEIKDDGVEELGIDGFLDE